ncbi:hypothetical protein HDU67_002961, partial [Dinochytrium kinnereticum]
MSCEKSGTMEVDVNELVGQALATPVDCSIAESSSLLCTTKCEYGESEMDAIESGGSDPTGMEVDNESVVDGASTAREFRPPHPDTGMEVDNNCVVDGASTAIESGATDLLGMEVDNDSVVDGAFTAHETQAIISSAIDNSNIPLQFEDDIDGTNMGSGSFGDSGPTLMEVDESSSHQSADALFVIERTPSPIKEPSLQSQDGCDYMGSTTVAGFVEVVESTLKEINEDEGVSEKSIVESVDSPSNNTTSFESLSVPNDDSTPSTVHADEASILKQNGIEADIDSLVDEAFAIFDDLTIAAPSDENILISIKEINEEDNNEGVNRGDDAVKQDNLEEADNEVIGEDMAGEEIVIGSADCTEDSPTHIGFQEEEEEGCDAPDALTTSMKFHHADNRTIAEVSIRRRRQRCKPDNFAPTRLSAVLAETPTNLESSPPRTISE